MSRTSKPTDGDKLDFSSVLTCFFPYAVGIILFISTARQFLISQEFNLPIFNYLEFSDLTIGIVNDLYSFIWFLIASLLLFSMKHYLKIIPTKFGWMIGLPLFMVFAAVIGISYWRHLIIDLQWQFWICVLIYAGLCMGALTIKCGQKSTKGWLQFLKQIDNKLLVFSMIIVFSFLFCKSLSRTIVYQIKHGGTKGTIIKFKDNASPFISNDTLYYIGNTTKYVFVYNAKSCRSICYSMENVSSITHTHGIK
jgi:hypothetical protein